MNILRQLVQNVRETQKPGSRADDHDAHVYLGNMYLAMGLRPRAIQEFETAYHLRPSEGIRRHIQNLRSGNGTQPSSAAGFAARAA